MSETVFVRQWKWLKDISGNNQTVGCLYTKLIIVLQLGYVYERILRHFRVFFSESCLFDILKKLILGITKIKFFRESFLSEISAETSRNIV